MINTSYTPSQQPMSQLVLVQNMPTSESVRYYATEAVPQPTMQHPTYLYSSSASVQHVPTPPQQQQQQQQFAHTAPSQSFYICQSNAMDMSQSGSSKLVYLMPATASSNPSPVSLFIRASGPNDASIMSNQPYPAAQMVTMQPYPVQQQQQQHQQQQQVTYVQIQNPAAARVPQQQQQQQQPLVMDPATKLALLRSPEVCRHYMNGRCNRRKCRFLHPDVQHASDTARLHYVAAESAAPHPNSLSSSANSFSIVPTPMQWSSQ